MQALTEILSMPCAAWVGVLWFVECMTFWTIFSDIRHQSPMIFSILALVFFVARKLKAVGRVGREVWSVKCKCGVRRAQCEV